MKKYMNVSACLLNGNKTTLYKINTNSTYKEWKNQFTLYLVYPTAGEWCPAVFYAFLETRRE